MLQKRGFVKIGLAEYDELIRCKIILDDIFRFCGVYHDDGEAQFYLDDELLKKVFPERCAKETVRVRKQWESLGGYLNV